jgi:hypothetical protein
MADDSALSNLQVPAGSEHDANLASTPQNVLKGIQIDSIPSWQSLEWSRNAPEGVFKSPAVPATSPGEEAPVVPLLSSDSEDDELSDSDEDYTDPLATKPVRTKAKKSRFPVRLDLNERISLWYVLLTFSIVSCTVDLLVGARVGSVLPLAQQRRNIFGSRFVRFVLEFNLTFRCIVDFLDCFENLRDSVSVIFMRIWKVG